MVVYCYKCGTQFQDGINFCPKCGAKMNFAEGHAVQITGQSDYIQGRPVEFNRGAMREAEINEAKKMLSYFSIKTEQYNEYDNVCRELCKLKKGRRMSCAVWGWILTILGIISVVFSVFRGLLAYFSTHIPNLPTEINRIIYDVIGSNKINISTPWPYFIVAAIAVLFMVFPGVLMIIVDKRKIKKGYLNEVDYYTSKYYSLNYELYNHYIAYKNCPIGPEYTNPANIRVILDTIISGRADTIKEAINILVEDAHRKRMEDYAAQTADFARRAAVQAGRAARASTVGAVFSAANFFS